MKGVVSDFPLRFEKALCALDNRQTIKSMVRREHPALPLHIALTDRQRQRPALDMQTRVGDITDFLRGNAPNAETLLIFRLNKSRRCQSR
ncbi:hypothetical protein D3C86_1027820 [compost metagenome]